MGINHSDVGRVLGFAFGGPVGGFVAGTLGAVADKAAAANSTQNQEAGNLTTHGDNVVDTGRYRIKCEEGSVKIYDKLTKTWTTLDAGTLQTSDGDSAQFDKNVTLQLQDGTKVTVQTDGEGNPSTVAVTQGDESVTVRGLNDGESGVKMSDVHNNADFVDARFSDGTRLNAGRQVDDLRFAGNGHALVGDPKRSLEQLRGPFAAPIPGSGPHKPENPPGLLKNMGPELKELMQNASSEFLDKIKDGAATVENLFEKLGMTLDPISGRYQSAGAELMEKVKDGAAVSGELLKNVSPELKEIMRNAGAKFLEALKGMIAANDPSNTSSSANSSSGSSSGNASSTSSSGSSGSSSSSSASSASGVSNDYGIEPGDTLIDKLFKILAKLEEKLNGEVEKLGQLKEGDQTGMQKAMFEIQKLQSMMKQVFETITAIQKSNDDTKEAIIRNFA